MHESSLAEQARFGAAFGPVRECAFAVTGLARATRMFDEPDTPARSDFAPSQIYVNAALALVIVLGAGAGQPDPTLNGSDDAVSPGY